jgi:hypothetical protein
MLDFLFVLPLLLCISAMIYILAFTLSAAAFTAPEHGHPARRHDRGGFMPRADRAIIEPDMEQPLSDIPGASL